MSSDSSGSNTFKILLVIGCAAAVPGAARGFWLEALRAIGQADRALFAEIAAVARAHYEEDRQSYHVSATFEAIPEAAKIDDATARKLLDDPDARQVLHVTYGSVLAAPHASP